MCIYQHFVVCTQRDHCLNDIDDIDDIGQIY
jgi:hypothetical protein